MGATPSSRPDLDWGPSGRRLIRGVIQLSRDADGGGVSLTTFRPGRELPVWAAAAIGAALTEPVPSGRRQR